MNRDNIHDSDIITLPSIRECGCGCGKIIKSKDKYGRIVRYVVGHNRRGKRIRDIYDTEIDKIKTLDEAKDIIKNQILFINDKDEYISKLEKRLNERQHTEYPKEITTR